MQTHLYVICVFGMMEGREAGREGRKERKEVGEGGT